MTVPAGSNLYSSTWSTLYNLISGNITDPSSRNKKFIVAGFPDTEGKNFPGFPIVIIDPLNSDDSRMNFGYTNTQNLLKSDVWIYSASNQQLDQLSDDVRDAIMSNKKVLAGSGITHVSITPGGTTTDIIAGSRIHSKLLNVNMQVVTP